MWQQRQGLDATVESIGNLIKTLGGLNVCVPNDLRSLLSMVPIPDLHLSTKSYNPAERRHRAGTRGVSAFTQFLGVVRSQAVIFKSLF